MANNEPQATDATFTQADDFKSINGIKQGIENRLHAAGILTYTQLASLTPEEIMAALGKVVGYTTRRINEEDWIGQAHEYAQKSEEAHQAPPTQPEERTIRQHYATFTIELLLGEENAVRRTKMVHIQSEAEETWAGWDESRLVGFIAQSAMVPAAMIPAAMKPVAERNTGEGVETQTIENKDRASGNLQAGKVASPPPLPVTGSPRLAELAVLSPSNGGQRRIVARDQPFEIRMTFDMTDVRASTEQNLIYRLTVLMKELGRGTRQVLDSTQGSFAPGDVTTLQIKSGGLPEGTYRISIDFSAGLPSSPAATPDLTEMFDGGLIRVY